MNSLISIIAGIGMAISSFFTPIINHFNQPKVSVGAFLPSGGGTYRLSSPIGTANTSFTLSSFKEPVSNIPYTMSYLNSDIGYGTIAPQTSYSEFVSFTGITQNADGTATLTGVSRGLGRSYPFTASSTLAQVHSGQSVFILSNAPQMYNEYVTKRGVETISAIKTFSVSPIVPDPTTALQVANKEYVDGVALVSAPNADTVTKGVVEIAGDTEYASTGGTGAALVVPASSASTTATANKLVRANGSGKISQSWLDLTEKFTFASTSTSFSGVSYNTPTTQSASTTLFNDGSGNLSWKPINSCYTGKLQLQSGDATTTITHNLGTVPTSFHFETISGSAGFGISFGSGTSTASQQYIYRTVGEGAYGTGFVAMIGNASSTLQVTSLSTSTAVIAWDEISSVTGHSIYTFCK